MDPSRKDVDAVRVALSEAPLDPGVVQQSCARLLERAERRPIDEPGDSEAANLAAEAAGRCLDALSAARRASAEIGGALEVLRANALRLLGEARDKEAVAAYYRALALDPDNGWWWYDLGLCHKRRGRWAEGVNANKRARALVGDGKPILWNLAICATALGQGEIAADAWRALGLDASVNSGGMPFVDGLPPVQVRAPVSARAQSAAFEAVWAQPLTPCHGVVQSPTFRDAPMDYGDIVLWDGAPIALVREREDGPEAPLFPLLVVLRRGDEHRFRFVALEQERGDVRALGDLPDGCAIAVHSERTEWVCPRCAAGEALGRHEHAAEESHRIVYGKLIAPASVELAQLRAALDVALSKRPSILLAVPALYEALGDTPAAGKAHRAWGAIERVGLRARSAARP